MTYDKTEMNAFVQSLYDAKMAEGKHGHYETMFHVVHKAIERVSPALPVQFLCDATRFKVCRHEGDGAARIYGLPSELNGRWVALVAADDNCHLAAARSQPVREPQEEVAIKVTVLTNEHPEGIPYDQWVKPAAPEAK